jgi:hypothetical protein
MAWSLIQSLKSTSTGSASTAVTAAFASSVTSGNRLFVFTTAFNQGAATDISAPVKSAGTATVSTFTLLKSAAIVPGSGKLFVDIWTATVTGTGTCTLSATSTSTSGSELGWTAQEYSGLDSSAGTGCLDVSAAGTGNSSSTATIATGTTAATSAANQLALAVVGDWGANATWTLSTANGFAKVAAASLDNDASAGMAVANKTSASGATESCVWTSGGVSDSDNACVVVIKLASGGGTPVALTGAVAAVTIAAPAGTVATQVDIALTGAVASVTIGAPAGTVLAAGPISLTGAVAAVTVAAPAGTVSATSPIALTGAVAGATTAAPAGTVALSVSLTASPASVGIAAPAGTVTTQQNIALTGAVAATSIAAPAGTAAFSVALTGAVAAISLSAPAGAVVAAGPVTLTGDVASLTITAWAGTAVAGGPVTLSGSVATLAISAPPGYVTAVVSVTYVFTPPTQNLHYGNWFTEPLTSRIPYPTGACVLKTNGFYATRWDAPVEADIENADTVYLGGHEYVISADEAAALTAAGYAANITTRY